MDKNITEDYVSFEVAKLLKEKGFPQEYNIFHGFVYNEKDYEDEYETQRMVLQKRTVKAGTLSNYPAGVPEPKCFCPTLQMAMKWLREKGFHIFVPIEIDYDEDERGKKWYYQPAYYPEILRVSDGKGMYDDGSLYATPELAIEAAIKYCLTNLI